MRAVPHLITVRRFQSGSEGKLNSLIWAIRCLGIDGGARPWSRLKISNNNRRTWLYARAINIKQYVQRVVTIFSRRTTRLPRRSYFSRQTSTSRFELALAAFILSARLHLHPSEWVPTDRPTDRPTYLRTDELEQKSRNKRSSKRLIVSDLFRDAHFSVPLLGKVVKAHYASKNKIYIPALLYLNTSHH